MPRPSGHGSAHVLGYGGAAGGGKALSVETPVLTTVPVDSAGEVKGDLVIHGRGDPDWNPRRRQEDFWKAFEPVVAVVQKAGVRRITGDIVQKRRWRDLYSVRRLSAGLDCVCG